MSRVLSVRYCDVCTGLQRRGVQSIVTKTLLIINRESMVISILKIAFSRKIVFNAIKIALVVGTFLNAINQGEEIINGMHVSWMHMFLNFLVPYCVASYSGAINVLDKSREQS